MHRRWRGILSAALAAAAILAPAARAQDPHPDRDRIATVVLENGGEARPAGMTITTAVPFPAGVVRDAAEIGLDTPGEVEVLERHADGSIKWARLRVRPEWKALRSAFVELRRGGARPPIVAAPFPDLPPMTVVFEDPNGTERRAELKDLRSIERTALHEVLRGGGPHVAPEGQEGVTGVKDLLATEIFVERFPGAPFVFATIVLRNDPPDRAVGAIRFKSYRLELGDPKWTLGVAWAKQNGATIEKPEGKPATAWLLPRDTKDLWLGDGQTKAWRLVIDASGDGRLFDTLGRILEHPFLPGISPHEIVRSRAWGDLGDMVLGPPPETARRLATDEFTRARKDRQYGWDGAWGDIKDSRQAGSPRNGLCSEGVLRTLQTGFREWFDLTYERTTQQALRSIVRGIRASEHPELLLYEGMPHFSRKDQLGRELPPDPRLEPFREPGAKEYRKNARGWNGFDDEHFTCDDVYAVLLLTGDPWARFEIESMGQALLTYDFNRGTRTLGTSRGCGWVLRGLALCYRATGDRAYLDACATLVKCMDAARGKGEIKWLHEAQPDPRRIPDHTSECCWEVAIAMDGLAAYLELSGDELAKTILLDCDDFLVKYGWNAKEKMFHLAVATDGSGVTRVEKDKEGTQSWIASALAAAERVRPRPEHAVMIETLFQYAKTSNASFEKGKQQWSWWQSALRWRFDRENAGVPPPVLKK